MMLANLIRIENIQVNIKVKDREDAIRQAAASLLNDGSIEARYVDMIIQTMDEVGPYIVIAKSVALSHTRPEYGARRLAMSFTTLEKGVNFGSPAFDPIKLIITLSATHADAHIDLMSELVDLLLDETKMESLFNAQTAEAFYGLISA